MKKLWGFIARNNLYMMTLLGALVAVLTFVYWAQMPVLQRLVSLAFIGLILHLWEEGKFPGGFAEMMTSNMKFEVKNPHFGEGITAIYVLVIVSLPFIFPKVTIFSLAALYLGTLEIIGHLAAIKIYKKSNKYSPGLITSIVALFPVSLYGIIYAARNNLMRPVDWFFSFLIMAAGLIIAQQIVVRSSGMKYSEFMKNVRKSFAKK